MVAEIHLLAVLCHDVIPQVGGVACSVVTTLTKNILLGHFFPADGVGGGSSLVSAFYHFIFMYTTQWSWVQILLI